MERKNWLKHTAIISLVFLAAVLVNNISYSLTGIPLKYRQSSDATVHVVNWKIFSENYSGNFDNDLMFQNYKAQSTGVLFIDKVLVRVAEKLNIGLLEWSIIISYISLAIFLSGVYFLVLYSTRSALLGLIISLVSVIPVISLGLSSWGFFVGGFVPKELALGIAVWLSILYLQGISKESKYRISIFFLLLGLFSNWYPVVFFHYAAVLLVVEIIRGRSLKKEHIFYGLLFLAASPVALFDIFVKASSFATPNRAIILNHYTATLHSWSYMIFHYLRKQILYILIIGFLWYIYRHVLKKIHPPLIKAWYAIWWSSLGLSLLGVYTELFAPLYMKYLISRTSVWFYVASMIIVAYTAREIYFSKFRRSIKNSIFLSLVLFFTLLGQTSILNVYNGIKEQKNNATDYKQYLSVVTELNSIVPPKSIVLSNPDREAKTIRVYGDVGSYVSWKDGNVTLFDGKSAEKWFKRYKKTQKVFSQKQFSAIQDFAVKNHLQFYLFNKKDIKYGLDELKEKTVMESGEYGLVRFY